MRVLGLIPARAGSKGIPGKNLRLLGGKPLLQYTAEAALEATRLDRVVLTTEDEEIARIGQSCGLDVPFRRPPDLATDDAAMLPVVQHALRALSAAGDTYDAVCLLQPTNPFRDPRDIDASIDLLEESGADCVVSVRPVPSEFHPSWTFFLAEDGWLRPSQGESLAPPPRRQDLPPAVFRDGSIYVSRAQVILETDSLYGQRLMAYETRHRRQVNLDTLEDWREAERMLSEEPV